MNCVPEHISGLAEILVLDGTAGASGMAPPASTRISARMKCVRDSTQFIRLMCRGDDRCACQAQKEEEDGAGGFDADFGDAFGSGEGGDAFGDGGPRHLPCLDWTGLRVVPTLISEPRHKMTPS